MCKAGEEKGFALYDSPVGTLRVEYENGVVTALKNAAPGTEPGVENQLTRQVFAQLDAYFRGERRHFDFPYVLNGTAFQKKVWAALRQIPYGETRSYGEIGQAIGQPKACRAVGMANNRNPMFIVVPCHRVIGADGSLVGYGGGLAMKQALLELEARYAQK